MGMLALVPILLNLGFKQDFRTPNILRQVESPPPLPPNAVQKKMTTIITSSTAAGNKLNKRVTPGDTGSGQGRAILRSEALTKCEAFSVTEFTSEKRELTSVAI